MSHHLRFQPVQFKPTLTTNQFNFTKLDQAIRKADCQEITTLCREGAEYCDDGVFESSTRYYQNKVFNKEIVVEFELRNLQCCFSYIKTVTDQGELSQKDIALDWPSGVCCDILAEC